MSDETMQKSDGQSLIYQIAYDSIRKGAPGLSDATCAVIAGSINIKVMLSTPSTRDEVGPVAGAGGAWPKTCDGIEQPAFELWAKSEGFDMNEHPIHYIFTDPETAAARIAWKAGLVHAVERMKAAPPPPGGAK